MQNAKLLQYKIQKSYGDAIGDSTVEKLSLSIVCMGGISWFFYFFAACCPFPPVLWLLVALMCAATAVLEGLVWNQMFSSVACETSTCSWGTGAKCAISAMTFWSLSTLMTCGVFGDAQKKKMGDDGGE